MHGHAIPCSLQPLVASLLFGALLGACGGDDADGGRLEAALGQGNADDIRAEYQAELASGALRVAPAALSAMPAQAEPQPQSQDASVSVSETNASGLPVQQGLDARRHDEASASATGVMSAQKNVPSPDGARLHAQQFHRLAQQVVEKVNAVRAQPQRCGDQDFPAVGPLVWNARVAYAALLESEWMVKHNAFSHQWEDGKYVWDRFDMAAYAWSKADENIAAGFSTLDRAMQAWVESPSHCRALMRADIRDVGLAVLPGQAGSRYGSYWTMALGAPMQP